MKDRKNKSLKLWQFFLKRQMKKWKCRKIEFTIEIIPKSQQYYSLYTYPYFQLFIKQSKYSNFVFDPQFFIILMNQQQKYFKPYKRMASPFLQVRRTPQSPQYSPKRQYDRKRTHTQYTHRDFHVPIWEHLYQQGLQKQAQKQQHREKSRNKIDLECTFQPTIKKNARYLVPSNSTFLQRNQVWIENKIEKIVKEKEQEITNNLKDCTFKPKINEKSKKLPKQGRQLTEHYFCNRHKSNCKGHNHNEKNMSYSRNQVNNGHRKSGNLSITINDPNSKKTNEKNVMQIGKIRSIIRNQLRRIEL